MRKTFLLHNTRALAPAVLGAGASVLFIAVLTFAATTINNNVNTGGTLTVSGASTLTGTTTVAGGIYASSTVFVDGIFTNTRNAILGAASGTPAVTGLNVTGNGYLTGGLGIGTATTSAGGLQITGMGVFGSSIDVRAGTSTFAGPIGFVGSTTPYLEVGFAGDVAVGGALGTSTLSIESSTGSRGGCIELRDSSGARWIRMYPGSGSVYTVADTFVASSSDGKSHGVGLLVIEVGRCQTGNE